MKPWWLHGRLRPRIFFLFHHPQGLQQIPGFRPSRPSCRWREDGKDRRGAFYLCVFPFQGAIVETPLNNKDASSCGEGSKRQSSSSVTLVHCHPNKIRLLLLRKNVGSWKSLLYPQYKGQCSEAFTLLTAGQVQTRKTDLQSRIPVMQDKEFLAGQTQCGMQSANFQKVWCD